MAFNTKCAALAQREAILGNTLERVIAIYLIQASVSRAYKQPSRSFPHQELDIHSNSKLSTLPHGSPQSLPAELSVRYTKFKEKLLLQPLL